MPGPLPVYFERERKMSASHLPLIIAAQKREKEEQDLSGYTQEALAQDWEFKILRSASGEFGKPGVIAEIMEEEALSGWVLLEKMDNNRIRFKRPANAKHKDLMLPPGIDPYRTTYGISEAAFAFKIIVVLFSIIGIVAALISLIQ